MILLKNLHLENFMAIESLDVDFDESCTIAIAGDNGSGKSTLFYAIAFCLVNYKKGERFDEYIKIGSQKAKLRLDAYLYGEPINYNIEIIKGKTQATVNRKVIYKNETYLNSDYVKFMKDHEFEYLESLMFMFQGGNNILTMKPSERAATLKRLFKFEFGSIVNSFKERQERDKSETVRLSTLINELKSRTFEKQPLLREVLPQTLSQWETRLTEVTKGLNQLTNIDDSSLKKIENDLIKTQTQINGELRKKASFESSLKDLNYKLSECEKFIESRNKNQLQIDLDKKKIELEKYTSDYQVAKKTQEEINKSLSVYNFELSEIIKQIAISETGICHACGQPIDESHTKKLKEKEAQLKKDIQDIHDKLLELNFDPENRKGKQIEKEIRFQEDQIRSYESELLNRESYKTRIEEINGNLNYVTTVITQYEKEKDNLLEEKTKLQSLVPLLEEKSNLEAEAEDLKQKIESGKENSIKNQERIRSNAQLAQDEKDRNERLGNLNLEYNSVLIDSGVVKTCIDVFENQFPNYIVLQACEQLETYVNEIIQKVFPYCKVSLKLVRGGVNFFYTIDEDSEEWLSVGMASGAQGQILSLAYEIALARLSGIQCILLDEIDAACSPENARIIYEFIASLDCFDQVIFISNRQESLETARKINPAIYSYRVTKGIYSPVANS